MLLKSECDELSIEKQLTICDLYQFVAGKITDGDGVGILLRTIYEGMVNSGIGNCALGAEAERPENISVSR
jgi:hypothetical protein